jgi:hypothetical protein
MVVTGQAVWLAPSHHEFGCVANLFSFHQTKDDLINEVFFLLLKRMDHTNQKYRIANVL